MGQQSRDLQPALSALAADLMQSFMLDPSLRLDADVDEAEAQEKYGFKAATEQVQGQEMTRLDFASLSPVQFQDTTAHPLGIARLSYIVHPHGERLDLHRLDTPICLYDGSTTESICTTPVLVKDVHRFELTFFNASGEEYDHWDSMDDEFDHTLPSRVRITLTAGRTQPLKTLSIQVFIPSVRPGEQ